MHGASQMINAKTRGLEVSCLSHRHFKWEVSKQQTKVLKFRFVTDYMSIRHSAMSGLKIVICKDMSYLFKSS